jgi:hypothetical protein
MFLQRKPSDFPFFPYVGYDLPRAVHHASVLGRLARDVLNQLDADL